MCPSGIRPVSSDYGQDCELSLGPIVTKFGPQLPINISKKRFLGSLRSGRGQGHVTKFLILILCPLTISAAHKDRTFKFYTEDGGVQENLYTGWHRRGQGHVTKFVILCPINYF